MYYGYDPSQGQRPGVPIKRYSGGPFVGFGIFQIIFGVVNATAGIIYLVHYWRCGTYWYYCPRYNWPVYSGSGIWSGLLLTIAGSVACGAGGQNSRGCANGTIATSVFSMIACGICIGFTAVDMERFFREGYWSYDRDYLVAIYISLVTSSSFGFIFSIVLIILGAKGANSANVIYPDIPMWGLGGGMMHPNLMPAMQPMWNQPAIQPILHQPQAMPGTSGVPGVPGMVDKDTKQLVIPTTGGPMVFVPRQNGNASGQELVEIQ